MPSLSLQVGGELTAFGWLYTGLIWLNLIIQVEEFDDIKSGYRIKLTFDENPFLSNKELVKEFFLGSAEPTSTSTKIEWKEGMDVVKRVSQIVTFP